MAEVIRLMYRAKFKDGQEEAVIKRIQDIRHEIKYRVDTGKLMTLSLFKWMNHLFLYYECIEEELHPSGIFFSLHPLLEEWPDETGTKFWVRMMDVFHFNEPQSVEHWRRKKPVEMFNGRVAHLKPEMVASYIYYHYQLQEEQAFHGNKYQIIGIDGNLLFLYRELPDVTETPLHKGRLNTKGTPENWEETRMDLHFIPWENGVKFFIDIDLIFNV